MRETPTQKLHRLLAEQGFEVTLWLPTLGYWRQCDVVRWAAQARHKDYRDPVSLDSWETVSDCARRGIDIEPDKYPRWQYGAFNVYAKSRSVAAAGEEGGAAK